MFVEQSWWNNLKEENDSKCKIKLFFSDCMKKAMTWHFDSVSYSSQCYRLILLTVKMYVCMLIFSFAFALNKGVCICLYDSYAWRREREREKTKSFCLPNNMPLFFSGWQYDLNNVWRTFFFVAVIVFSNVNDIRCKEFE